AMLLYKALSRSQARPRSAYLKPHLGSLLSLSSPARSQNFTSSQGRLQVGSSRMQFQQWPLNTAWQQSTGSWAHWKLVGWPNNAGAWARKAGAAGAAGTMPPRTRDAARTRDEQRRVLSMRFSSV